MARLAIAKRSVRPVIIRTKINDATVYVREPMDIVKLDYGDGSIKTFLEPAGTLLMQPSPDDANSRLDASQVAVVWEDLAIFDVPPFANSRFGVVCI